MNGKSPPYPTTIRGPAIAGLLIITVGLLGSAVWGSMTPLDTAVLAPGTVVVDGNRKSVQHLEGGTIEELLVQEGDLVQKGQAVVYLDQTRARASLEILQGRFDSERARAARLLAEQGNVDVISFPKDLLKRGREEVSVAALLEGQREIFVTRNESLRGQETIFRNRIEQSRSQIEGLQLNEASLNQQMQLLRLELSGVRKLFKKGHAPKTRLLELERSLANVSGQRGELLSQIAGIEQAIGESQLQILQLEKGFKEQIAQELRQVEAEIDDLNERLIAARDSLERLTIRSPATGKIVGLSVHTVGGVVRAGEPIMEIVPRDDSLVIDVEVSPTEVDDLVTGMVAEVRFTSFADRSLPVIEGQVAKISADRLFDRDGQRYYFSVRVHVPEDQIDLLGDHQLVPGMPAEIVLLTGERTLADYLITPVENMLRFAFREA